MRSKTEIPCIIGHRGCKYPGYNQNTIRAYEKIFDEGATAFEFDVQKTLDGALVIVHNLYLDKVSTGSGPVCQATSAYIDTLWAGNPSQGKDKIPYLSELIDLMASYGKEIRPTMHLELKGTGAGTPTGAMLGQAIASGKIREEDVLVSSFNWDELRDCSHQCPQIPLALLAGAFTYEELIHSLPHCDTSYFQVFGNLSERYLQPQRPTFEENKRVIDDTCDDQAIRTVLYEYCRKALDGSLYDETVLQAAKSLHAQALNLWHRSATIPFMKKAQEQGLKVQLYTVNDPKEIRAWTVAGIDGLFTDTYKETQEIVDETLSRSTV